VSELRILTRDPELSPLAALALQDGAPGGWFTARARNSAEWVAQIDSVRAEFDHRSWRESLAPALSSTGAAAERLARVAAAGGVVVTTGQQPGLFGGPIYTFSKALGALALADVLEAATGIPVAPVFWAATYDADFAEASVTYLASGDHVERLRMSPPDSPPRGMSETPLGDVTPLVRLLERGTGAAADPGVMALVRAAYHEGATVSDAFVSLLRALLEPLGIAVLDAGQACVRQAERPLMLRALRDAAAVEAAVQARDDTLRRLGHEPVVAQVPGLSLVFTTENGVRSRVPIADAPALAGRAPELEPNVLLRPVAERAILPTVAYLGGPSEVAYFAQASAAAAALGAPVQVVVPRWSGVIVEPHVQRVLDRYGLRVEDLRDADATLGRLARDAMSGAVRDALARARASVDDAVQDLELTIGASDPPLVPQAVTSGAQRALQHRLDRLERRLVAAIKRREADMVRDISTARAALYPLGKPQERVLNLMPMLARHGRSLLGMMLDRAREQMSELVDPARDTSPLIAHGDTGSHD